MSELQNKCSTTFEKLGLNLYFLDYYDSKGNIGVLGDGVPVEDIQNALFQAIGKTCAIVRPDVVKQVNLAFRDFDIPPSVSGFRWTRGVSLLCEGEVKDQNNEKLFDPEIGFFLKIGPEVIIVYRMERETERGTLDSGDRKGGWTAVSGFTEKVNGGLWTARSLRIVRGLLERVNFKMASKVKREEFKA